MKRCSVCMPSYNGEKYIEGQIRSILSQLRSDDELIISDDSSTDNTPAIVRKIGDSRIRLLENNTCRSPVLNLQNALMRATGEVVFLSDQDDLWHDGKLSRIAGIFDDNPGITLIASDARIMDGRGRIIADSYYARGMAFTPRAVVNIVKNRYLGCTLAFRSSMFKYILPFPPDIPMHDVWIGILNDLYGSVHFIHEPLIDYRRHGGNFSPAVRSNFRTIVRWRWNLIRRLLERIQKVGLWR